MYDNLILRYLYKSICSYTEWESHFITKPLKNYNESKISPWTWAAMTSGAILAPALTSQSLGPGWKFRDFMGKKHVGRSSLKPNHKKPIVLKMS